MEEMVNIFANAIFPVAVSMYCLLYLNIELKNLSKEINNLSYKIQNFCDDEKK